MFADALSAEGFAGLVARLGPFERAAEVGVGVSGGPDSMALTLMLGEWASVRGGRVEAVTVDHGLRLDSAAEAVQVGAWLARFPGIRHRILRWEGEKPATGIQAAARAARHRLLADHCRQNGILHLFLAHHLDDQIETRRMREARGSGAVGLAAMNAVREWRGVRLLRPLLGIPKKALRATLRARRQEWIEDPSNENQLFERTRLRAGHAGDDANGSVPGLHRAGLERLRLERAAAARVGNSLILGDGGWAMLDPGSLADRSAAASLALGEVLQCLGGAEYPVAEGRRADALATIGTADWPAFTLGGCHLSLRRGRLTICRDWGAIEDRRPARPGDRLTWDRRFALALSPDLPAGDVTIARLGEDGVQWLGREGALGPRDSMPEPARKALPALWREGAPIAAPGLGFGNGMTAHFRPERSATSSGFTVAY